MSSGEKIHNSVQEEITEDQDAKESGNDENVADPITDIFQTGKEILGSSFKIRFLITS